jgi:hypothetical protein
MSKAGSANATPMRKQLMPTAEQRAAALKVLHIHL